MRALAVVALAACGSPRPGPAAPRPLDPAELARELHAEMTEMAAITDRLRVDCPRMAGELRALFARMRTSVDRAHELARDSEQARRLTTELRAYDAETQGLTERISTHLVACKDDPAVRDAMSTMPTL
ncbi:MAG: hypothetical protein ACTHU0_01865 [Kofleriaceae bacterium]